MDLLEAAQSRKITPDNCPHALEPLHVCAADDCLRPISRIESLMLSGWLKVVSRLRNSLMRIVSFSPTIREVGASTSLSAAPRADHGSLRKG